MKNVAGFQLNTFIDYPGKVAAIVFTGGCNMRCYYCHNHEILCSKSNTIPVDEIIEKLKSQTDFLDGVVISGGEPTIHADLPKLIEKIKAINPTNPFLIKLDTNGTNPQVLKELVTSGLVDYVAMDIKASPNKYKEICGIELTDQIQQSVNFLINFPPNRGYMFRTTLCPLLTQEDLIEMGKLIDGAKVWQLQKFEPNEFSQKNTRISGNATTSVVCVPYNQHVALQIKKDLEKYANEILIRGF